MSLGAPIPECVVSPGDNCLPVQVMVLCDQHPPPDAGDGALVPFIREFQFNCDTGALIGFNDYDFDGAPYSVIGTVQDCAASAVVDADNPVNIRRENLVGPSAWSPSPCTIAVTVKVRAVGVAGSVTFTDEQGIVSDMFVGDEESWRSPSDVPFYGSATVTLTDPGDLVTVIWSEVPGCAG